MMKTVNYFKNTDHNNNAYVRKVERYELKCKWNCYQFQGICRRKGIQAFLIENERRVFYNISKNVHVSIFFKADGYIEMVKDYSYKKD